MDDLIEGMYRLMNSEGITGPINIGNPDEFSMLELAEKVIGMTESDSEIVFRELPQDDPVQRKPVIDMAQRELDWKPWISLDEGLRRTIAYFKAVL